MQKQSGLFCSIFFMNLFQPITFRQNEQKESNRVVKETSTFLKQLSQLHTTSPTEVV